MTELQNLKFHISDYTITNYITLTVGVSTDSARRKELFF